MFLQTCTCPIKKADEHLFPKWLWVIEFYLRERVTVCVCVCACAHVCVDMSSNESVFCNRV